MTMYPSSTSLLPHFAVFPIQGVALSDEATSCAIVCKKSCTAEP